MGHKIDSQQPFLNKLREVSEKIYEKLKIDFYWIFTENFSKFFPNFS